MKWSFLPNNLWPHYVVANADESEPGTFKDREIMESNPFQFLEGLMIAAYAVQANVAYVYLRGEFWQHCAQPGSRKSPNWKQPVCWVTICLARTIPCACTPTWARGLISAAKKPRCSNRWKASWASRACARLSRRCTGLYGKPTVINNVETLTNLPPILQKGAAWYRGFGTEKSPGVKIFCLSGCVNRPGNYELPLGTTFPST